jgi:polysaccharide transporter, PST family
VSDSSSSSRLRADSLAFGLALMLLVTAFQRLIGLLRNLGFCHFMDDTELGLWSMAFGFLTLASPMLMLGIPGTMVRFVEHFRLQGQLKAYLKKVSIASLILATIGCLALLAARDRASYWIFGIETRWPLVTAIAIGVITTIVFNTSSDMTSALRQLKTVSRMQFMQSFSFTVLSIAWLALGGGLTGIVISLGIANVLGAMPGWWVLAKHWHELPQSTDPIGVDGIWRRVGRYAIALWGMNLLFNSFEMVDRYMLLHWTPGGTQAGQALVGQYHSGRVLPQLLMSLAMLASSSVMPYLAADWERGKRKRVAWRTRQLVFACSLAFTFAGAMAVLFGPWLFSLLTKQRYAEGLAVMPIAFVFTIWSGIALVAEDYLWCAERGRSVSIILAVALICSMGLNALLLPRYGLQGAALATLLANLLLLCGVWLLMARNGYQHDVATIWTTLVPATLLAGPWLSLLAIAIAIAGTRHGRRIYHQAHQAVTRRLSRGAMQPAA